LKPLKERERERPRERERGEGNGGNERLELRKENAINLKARSFKLISLHRRSVLNILSVLRNEFWVLSESLQTHMYRYVDLEIFFPIFLQHP